MSKLPTFGVIGHLTAIFDVPITLAVNFADRPVDNVTGPGMIETLTFERLGVTNEMGCSEDSIAWEAGPVPASAEVAEHRLSEAVASIARMAVTDMN